METMPSSTISDQKTLLETPFVIHDNAYDIQYPGEDEIPKTLELVQVNEQIVK